MVEINELRAFEMLAIELHFAHAAERLGVSQSTVSRRISSLERWLGVTLADRTSRSVTLTAAGTALAQTLPPALRQLDRALSAVQVQPESVWRI